MSLGSRNSILPGFRLSLGVTVFYLSAVVLLPLSMVFLKASTLSWDSIVALIFSSRAIAAYKLSFGASLAAALTNLVFGLIVAWVLVRYSFPGKRLLDGLVDLPFALPTAVAGIALTTVYAPSGVLGAVLKEWGLKVAFAPLGVYVALTFVGLPFVVRTVQPVLEDLEAELEEAAATLGAGRFYTFRKVILGSLWPSLLTGFSLSFARSVGEYGSVVFISGNMPNKTEIVPLLIMTQLEQFNYAGATALAIVMLLTSFLLMFLVNLLQYWGRRRLG